MPPSECSLVQTARSLNAAIVAYAASTVGAAALSVALSLREGTVPLGSGSGVLSTVFTWFVVLVPLLRSRAWFELVAANGDERVRAVLGESSLRTLTLWQYLNSVMFVLSTLGSVVVVASLFVPFLAPTEAFLPPWTLALGMLGFALPLVANRFLFDALRDWIAALSVGSGSAPSARLIRLLGWNQGVTIAAQAAGVLVAVQAGGASASLVGSLVVTAALVVLLELLKRFARQARPAPPLPASVFS